MYVRYTVATAYAEPEHDVFLTERWTRLKLNSNNDYENKPIPNITQWELNIYIHTYIYIHNMGATLEAYQIGALHVSTQITCTLILKNI